MELQVIQSKIYEIRGNRVMLDRDLAELYGVETRALNQAVKRNPDRFPPEFMFQLSDDETENWKSQIVITNSVVMGLRRNPYAFTEQGIAMLSAVLKSSTAVQVSINIMNAFVYMRRFFVENRDLLKSVDVIRKRIEALEEANEETLSAVNDLSEDTRKELDDIYLALSELSVKQVHEEIEEDEKPRKPIGFKSYDK